MLKWLWIMLIMIVCIMLVNSCLDVKNPVKKLPDIVYPPNSEMSLFKLGRHFGHQLGHNSRQIQVPRDVRMVMLDGKYASVDYHWFLRYNNWFSDMLFHNGLMSLGGHPENFDCDNYAMLYKSLMSVAAYKAKETVEPAVATVFVENRHAFGGVPAGGLHMVVLVMTSREWYIVEPQTGEYIELHNYPNQQHVKMLTF